VAINILGSKQRIELALSGRTPGEIGHELVTFVERINPPSLKNLWDLKSAALRLLLSSRLKPVRRPLVQEIVEQPDLDILPALKAWPNDGGRFITWPLVLTASPVNGRSNLGIYRMQLFGKNSTGMHWQIQRGGGFHYAEAERQGKPLELAAVLGGDPALMLAGVLPLPEGLEELVFSGILRGSPTRMTKSKTLNLRVPANAEFVLEGHVPPNERANEGPFGDHFGHYSQEAPFPVFRINTITRRRNPIFPAAVVGKPPQEDRYLGDAVQEFGLPLLKLVHPEIEDLWAYYQAGFVNLAVASVRGRYTKEPMKTALALLGEGQLSLSKCVILVGPDVNVRDFESVLREIRCHFKAEEDFLLLPRVPLDTLDFTSFKMHLGSKMVLDATPKLGRQQDERGGINTNPQGIGPGIKAWRLLQDTMLIVQAEGNTSNLIARLASSKDLANLKLIAIVSPDVNLDNPTELLWGIFTRFDPARDVLFPEMKMVGAAPVYRGPLIIDSTFKPGYPKTLIMKQDITKLVTQRWDEYFRKPE
ncbi:UbiD family decarboxylase, partial [Dehalococcoidia bacterium]|nr:UbiD family decarboxylase [Dehalococcoidia bacterium]